MNNPPNPFGSCFDAVAHNVIGNLDIKTLRVVHGIGIANREGEEGNKIAHAWIEFEHNHERIALDCIWLVYTRASEYRRGLQLEYFVEYSLTDFLRLWEEFDYSGPWDDLIMQHTGDYKKENA